MRERISRTNQNEINGEETCHKTEVEAHVVTLSTNFKLIINYGLVLFYNIHKKWKKIVQCLQDKSKAEFPLANMPDSIFKKCNSKWSK